MKLRGVGMGDVRWTDGFWAERFSRSSGIGKMHFDTTVTLQKGDSQ